MREAQWNRPRCVVRAAHRMHDHPEMNRQRTRFAARELMRKIRRDACQNPGHG